MNSYLIFAVIAEGILIVWLAIGYCRKAAELKRRDRYCALLQDQRESLHQSCAKVTDRFIAADAAAQAMAQRWGVVCRENNAMRKRLESVRRRLREFQKPKPTTDRSHA